MENIQTRTAGRSESLGRTWLEFSLHIQRLRISKIIYWFSLLEILAICRAYGFVNLCKHVHGPCICYTYWPSYFRYDIEKL